MTTISPGARSLIFGLALLLATAGCDLNSQGPAGPTKPTTIDIGGNDPNTLVAFGDSISDGQGSANRKGYRDDLEALFHADGRDAVRVVDEGVGGTYSSNGVRRISTVLRRDKPAVLILLYGTNDEYSSLPKGVSSARATTSQNLRSIVAAARANSTIVVLSTLPPVCTAGRAFQRSNVDALNEKIRALGAELHATDEGLVLADPWNAFLAASPPDGCALIDSRTGNHPNDQGYTLLAQTYYDALADLTW